MEAREGRGGKRKLATLEKSPFCGTESHEKVLNQVSESATESYMQRSFKLNISETNQEKWEGEKIHLYCLTNMDLVKYTEETYSNR